MGNSTTKLRDRDLGESLSPREKIDNLHKYLKEAMDNTKIDADITLRFQVTKVRLREEREPRLYLMAYIYSLTSEEVAEQYCNIFTKVAEERGCKEVFGGLIWKEKDIDGIANRIISPPLDGFIGYETTVVR